MNAGVALCQSYLHLNGYFTQAEVSVVRQDPGGGFREVTDLDLLGVRLPSAATVVPAGRPGPEGDILMEVDPVLDLAGGAMDVVIAEVKEGEARLNESHRHREVLTTALRRVGCCPEDALQGVVGDLQRRGRATLAEGPTGPWRVRLLAFGEGQTGSRGAYAVISLRHVADFVEGYLDRYHEVLNPAALGDPVLGLLHLLRKLR